MMSPTDIAERVVLPEDQAAADMLEVAEVVYWRADVEFGARLNGGELTQEEKESIEAVGVEAKASGLFQVYPSGDLKLGNKPIRKWTTTRLKPSTSFPFNSAWRWNGCAAPVRNGWSFQTRTRNSERMLPGNCPRTPGCARATFRRRSRPRC